MKRKLAFIYTFICSFSLYRNALAIMTMNTPATLVQCQPSQLTWNDGKPPYFLSVQDGNNPNGPALFRFEQQLGSMVTWKVNFTAGTSLSFLLRDSTGAVAQTATVKVQSGSDASCLFSSQTSTSQSTSSQTQTSQTDGGPSSNTSDGGSTKTSTTPSSPVTAPTTTSRPSAGSGSSQNSQSQNSSSGTKTTTISPLLVPTTSSGGLPPTTTTNGPDKRDNHTPLIVGTVVGSITLNLAIFGSVFFFLRLRRRKKADRADALESNEYELFHKYQPESVPHPPITPFVSPAPPQVQDRKGRPVADRSSEHSNPGSSSRVAPAVREYRTESVDQHGMTPFATPYTAHDWRGRDPNRWSGREDRSSSWHHPGTSDIPLMSPTSTPTPLGANDRLGRPPNPSNEWENGSSSWEHIRTSHYYSMPPPSYTS